MIVQRKGKKSPKHGDSAKGAFGMSELPTSATKDFENGYEHRLNAGGNSGPDKVFWLAFFSSQILAVISLALVAYLGVLSGGYGWNSDPFLQFNYHPLLMILGLVLFYGDSIMIYRALYFLPKWVLKWIHAFLHFAAIIFSSVGLAAVFENHRRLNRADMYSLHSWIGIGTFAFFCMQFVGSFMAFFIPSVPVKIRATIMPFHTFFGVVLFILAVATALMGLTEKLIWTDGYADGKYIKTGATGNALGIFITIFAILVVFLATRDVYKRKPRPAEVAPTN